MRIPSTSLRVRRRRIPAKPARARTTLLLSRCGNTVAGITILAYILYTVDSHTLQNVGSNHLLYTTPFVIYALFRYIARVQTDKQGEDPTDALLRDRSMIITVLLWLVIVFLVMAHLL